MKYLHGVYLQQLDAMYVGLQDQQMKLLLLLGYLLISLRLTIW